MNNILKLSDLYSTLVASIASDTDFKLSNPQYHDILKSYTGDDWIDYVIFSPDNYNRVRIDTSTCSSPCSSPCNAGIELILICWNVGQGSPIHDHPENGCLVKILRNELTEELYDENVKLSSIRTLGEGDISYMESNKILHRILNPTTNQTTSIHIYSPPKYICKSYR
jgi:predicted metal-dependent enzyme (double-stranded beta helix superfamily)